MVLRTLADALEALSVCTDYEKMARTGQGYARFDLRTISRLARTLGDPQTRYRCVHVAGTKGKGSTTHLLSRILAAAGERVGEYTSPHLQRVTERIRVAGCEIPGEAVAAILGRLEAELRPEVEDRPTFFDFFTAIAFEHFARESVTFAAIEVGLGGRLDSTNVIRPDVSVITSISHDHVETLGSSLAEIAGEKAGIVKAGVPVVTGVSISAEPGSKNALRVIRDAARQKKAPLLMLDRDFGVGPVAAADAGGRPGIRFAASTWRTPRLELVLPVLGAHQARNAAVAIATADVLRDAGVLEIDDEGVRAALSEVELPGRMEFLGERPVRLVDAAHNDASARATADALRLHFPDRKAVVCFGCARDKDIPAIFRELEPIAEAFVLTRAPSPRGADPEALARVLGKTSAPIEIRPEPEEALRAACERAGTSGIVLVTGSFYLAGVVRAGWARSGGGRWGA
jgi:dihydrofolate synthase/folylpolyglutamate synthase